MNATNEYWMIRLKDLKKRKKLNYCFYLVPANRGCKICPYHFGEGGTFSPCDCALYSLTAFQYNNSKGVLT